jgi:hypothetical protein
MSGKSLITIAAAATVAVAALATSSSTYARGFTGGGFAHANFARGGFAHFTPRAHFAPRMVRTTGVGRVTSNPGRLCILGRSCGPRPPVHPPIWVWHHHFPHHWVFRGGHWIVEDVAAVESPVVVPPTASTPGPCTCLTKTYTPTGLVVFADVCTKESASAPATDDTADASQEPTSPVSATATPIAQVPTTPNYAGRTYQDYLAANPQAAQPQAAQQTPPPPQQN